MPFALFQKFQCEKCLQTFVSKQKSEQHRCKVEQNIVKQSTAANQCKDCLKTFSSVFNKKRHKKVCSTVKTKGEQTKEIKEKVTTNGDDVTGMNTKKT